MTLTSKLIDGTFPEYQRVIPTGNDKVLEVVRDELKEAVDRVSTVSTEKSRAVKLNLEKGQADAQRRQSRGRNGDRRAAHRLQGGADRNRVQRALHHGHSGAHRRRQGDLPVFRCGIADLGARQRRRCRALRADADARVEHCEGCVRR